MLEQNVVFLKIFFGFIYIYKLVLQCVIICHMLFISGTRPEPGIWVRKNIQEYWQVEQACNPAQMFIIHWTEDCVNI